MKSTWLDHIFQPVNEKQVAILIHHAQIAGVQDLRSGIVDLEVARGVEEVGPLLASKLLALGLLVFLGILLLSNLIAALSSFFLSRDLPWIRAAPADWLSVYLSRLTETVVSSSWMVVLMLVPMLAAYERVYEGGWAFVGLSVEQARAKGMDVAEVKVPMNIDAKAMINNPRDSSWRALRHLRPGQLILEVNFFSRGLSPNFAKAL